MDEVLTHLDRQVAADGAGRRISRFGGADHGSDHADGVWTLQCHGHERARRDEGDETIEERLALVDRVVSLRQVPIDLDELEPHDLEAALLEAGDDLAGQLALDAVRLDEYESSIGHSTDT